MTDERREELVDALLEQLGGDRGELPDELRERLLDGMIDGLIAGKRGESDLDQWFAPSHVSDPRRVGGRV